MINPPFPAHPPPELTRVLWGKTDDLVKHRAPEGRWHPLVFHLIDTANVAAALWDTYLSDAVKSALGSVELGRPLFRWLCALHDIGKATPVFQGQSDRHFLRVERCSPRTKNTEWRRHEQLSSHVVRELLHEHGWKKPETRWIGTVLAAHHGTFPGTGFTHAIESATVGGVDYRRAQRYLFESLTRYCEIDLEKLRGFVPSPGAQMAVSGALVMADWLASNEAYFRYGPEESKPLPHEYAPSSTARASAAFRKVTHLQEVWHPDPGDSAHDLCWRRFGIEEPHDTQIQADALARTAERPGLMVIEAPTGEGKTEAALVAAEVLADRFGHNGLFFALPTQATTDGIFDRLLKDWSESQEHKPTVNLAHGKARLKKEFDTLPLGGIGDDGHGSLTASTWMRGAKKALLSPITVGTVDQLLFAGVAARYAQLRHIGLANKVVVVDEVHAYDTYMSTILQRALYWLGLHEVPVLLLSATLSPEQRESLLSAYCGAPNVLVEGAGYPRLTWAQAPTPDERLAWEDEEATVPLRSHPATTGRDGTVQLGFFPEREESDLKELIEGELAGARKGNVLVLRNTVKRAQETFERLRRQFDDFDVTLTHARFTSGDRARKDSELLRRYGPPSGRKTREHPARPERSIVVATQVAEQSLDIDFDLVVSDLAPIDLLLQRAGRCHRHERPEHVRGSLTRAKLVVTGYRQDGDLLPELIGNTRRPYDHHLLYRTLAALTHPEPRTEIKVPSHVPDLISQVYGDAPLGPESWQEAMDAASEDSKGHIEELRVVAKNILIGRPDPEALSLADIFPQGNNQEVDDDEEDAVARYHLPVRHGPPSVEAVLLYRTGNGRAAPISQLGEPDPVTVPLSRPPEGDELELVGEQAIRLPHWDVDRSTLITPQGWKKAHWARNLQVLFLEQDGTSRQRRSAFRYSSKTGWTPTQ